MKLGRFQFSYNAISDKGRRQSPATRVLHEQSVLNSKKRERLLATAQDQIRNHSLVAWMVRKHLDYVSKFHFSFRTENDSLDTIVNRIFRWHGAPRNLDYMGRFGRDEMFRMFELEKVTCGDAGLLKLPDLKMQAIESDEIGCGDGAPANTDNHIIDNSGIVTDKMGVPIGYCLRKRSETGYGYEYLREAEMDEIIFDAYWTRFKSQYRGVSPLSTAINTVQDLSEAFEFNLVKAKMHAIFGVAIMRKAEEDGGFGGSMGATSETEDAEPTAQQTELELNPRSINIMDLNPGEDIKTIESGTPSSEFIEGSYLFIQLAMLALDIPVTCFDSRRSSFSARIADLNEYEVSADSKRTKNRYVRKAYSDWVIETIWNDANTPWPLRQIALDSGFSLRDVQEEVEWIPSGAPWLDKFKQIQGDELAISLMLDNSIDAARRKGQDVFHNIDQQAKVLEYAKSKGVPIVTRRASDSDSTETTATEPEEKERGDNE
jgi:capsid protein